MSKNGSIMLSKPFSTRLNLINELKNNNARTGTTAKKLRSQRITTFHKEVTE